MPKGIAGSSPAGGVNYAFMAQLVERILGKDEVTSSTLVESFVYPMLTQLDRVPVFEIGSYRIVPYVWDQ